MLLSNVHREGTYDSIKLQLSYLSSAVSTTLLCAGILKIWHFLITAVFLYSAPCWDAACKRKYGVVATFLNERIVHEFSHSFNSLVKAINDRYAPGTDGMGWPFKKPPRIQVHQVSCATSSLIDYEIPLQ